MAGLSRRNLTRLNKPVSLVRALPRGRLIAGASNGHYWPRLVRGLFVHEAINGRVQPMLKTASLLAPFG
jgi:hypothetical protein